MLKNTKSIMLFVLLFQVLGYADINSDIQSADEFQFFDCKAVNENVVDRFLLDLRDSAAEKLFITSSTVTAHEVPVWHKIDDKLTDTTNNSGYDRSWKSDRQNIKINMNIADNDGYVLNGEVSTVSSGVQSYKCSDVTQIKK